MSTPYIPHPHNPDSVICRLPRSKVVGPALEDELTEAELKALDTQLRASTISWDLKSIMSNLAVRVEEFDCE